MVMKMKWLLCMMVIVAALATAVQADVYIVARYAGARDAMETFLLANFSAGTLGTINKGNYRDAVPSATADDLVIILRESSSGWYDDSEAEVRGWNDLTAPILSMSPYQPDLDKWGWTAYGGQISAANDGLETEVLSPSDPLFAGVTITGGYADLVIDGGTLNSQEASGLLPAGATILAEGLAGTTPTATLARIPKGTSWSTIAQGGVSGTHAGPRMIFFTSKNDQTNGINTSLTADGLIVLGNCVEELLSYPIVDAGIDQAIGSLSTSILGTATNPDPNDTLTYLWTTEDAGVTFGTPTDPNTTATFDDFGTYVLTLTATNTIPLTGSDSLTVVVIDPGDASDPDPADGATDVVVAPTLSWTAGAGVVTRDVWFGKSAGAMELVLDDQTETTYAPGTLIKGQTYYWAVDETDSSAVTHEGFVWSFTVAALSGTTSWTGGDGGSNLWNIEANWDIGVPGLGNQANIHVNGPALIDSTVEAVATGTWARWGIPDTDPNTDTDTIVLEMTGGSLTLNRWALGNAGQAIVNISDGTISTSGITIMGDGATYDTTLNISGGTVDLGANLRMKDAADSVVNLTGGVLTASGLDFRTGGTSVNIINLAGGTLILRGDDTGTVNDYVDSGRIIAYGGAGKVIANYDEVTDKTTVIACSDADRPDLTGDCAVNEDDLQLVVQDWLFTTPPDVSWSFDMASDPVGTGEFDLKVRGDDPGNANYTMGDDTGSGTLEVTGAGTLLLDQQFAGTAGLFDTDVHYVIKSTNEYAVDLWIYMATSSVEGRQSAVGISTMKDPVDSSQTVEIWGGAARQQGAYAPAVVETGFDPNSYLTIDVNYDYDTDTYDWSISDGSETRVGFDVPYTDTGNGDGGYFTLKSGSYGGGAGNASPGSALIDQLNIAIAGTIPIVKPGDVDKDGDVELIDFAKIAEYWMTSDD